MSTEEFLPYCTPGLNEDEIDAVAETLRKGWLTSGPAVKAFEAEFAERSGVKHAIALNSCTAALHTALLAVGIGPGDEVVMPSLTFVAGAQCTLELGARPVFADVDPRTLSVTVETIDAVVTERAKAIMPMPYGGRPLDIDAIVTYARERGLRVIEDAAHGAGMLDRGEWAGTRSDAAAYSFYATKNLTTAEGGMLLTNDDTLAERVRRVGLHGMDKDAWKRYSRNGAWRYDVTEPGFKYNLADPLAALGLVQLRRLDAMQERRDQIAATYDRALREIRGITTQAPVSNGGDRHSWCMYAIAVDEQEAGITRDALIEELRDQNIGTSVHYIPTHLFTAYRDLQKTPLPNTEAVWQKLISLPLYPAMSDADVERVVTALQTVTTRSTSLRAAPV